MKCLLSKFVQSGKLDRSILILPSWVMLTLFKAKIYIYIRI